MRLFERERERERERFKLNLINKRHNKQINVRTRATMIKAMAVLTEYVRVTGV